MFFELFNVVLLARAVLFAFNRIGFDYALCSERCPERYLDVSVDVWLQRDPEPFCHKKKKR